MVNISIKCNETLQNICWEYNISIFKYQNVGFTELSPWKWVGEKPENTINQGIHHLLQNPKVHYFVHKCLPLVLVLIQMIPFQISHLHFILSLKVI